MRTEQPLDRCQRALQEEIAVVASVHPRDLFFKRSTGAFAPLVSMSLKRPCAENEVDKNKFVRGTLGAEFPNHFGQFVGHSRSFRADFDNSTMTEAAGASSLGRGG